MARPRLGPAGPAAAVAIDDHWVRTAALDPDLRLVSDALADVARLGDAVTRAGDVERFVSREDAVPVEAAELEVPLDRTGKLLAIGRNYLAHIEETRESRPEQPLLFGKFPSALTGPYSEVTIDDRLTAQADYEVELAVVIGPGGRDVAAADAGSIIAGYAVANDLSSRDNQAAESQWIRSKSFDGFCPFGPWITTADEVRDPVDRWLTTHVNGELRQNSNTGLMLFGVPELVEYLSLGISLEPGDVILTGTPSGVAVGMAEPAFLRPGDLVRCEVQGLGYLENLMVAPK